MTKTLTDITAQLERPFAIQDVDLLPKGQIERDGKTLCMALPYADVRVYEDRLNQVAPGEWSTPPPVALAVGQKIIVYVTVTVCGVSHTDVGESAASSENAGTESWAQAFKRACSQFGLGRYLYDLEKAWVPYNKQGKRIDLNTEGIAGTVRQMYQKAHIQVQGATNRKASNGEEESNKSTPTARQNDQQAAQSQRANSGTPAQENSPTPIHHGERVAQTTYQIEMDLLLKEFYELSPATYAKISNWKQKALRTALAIPGDEQLPSDYTPEDIARMSTYVASKRSEKSAKVAQAS